MPQNLSSKEASLFRQVVKYFESKQYKKGIKAADQILRKSPNHGETQAMKALNLNGVGQTEEAFALAKVALKNDMKSHVTWHVYGLLWRSAKNFEEAIKAYKFALRIEPESAQILRDLALLQVQMRDYQGYIESRKKILQARPQLRQNWTGMAIAHHLAGDYAEAEKVLNTYEETLKTPPPKSDIEHSEAVLYKNSIIAESGDIQRALDHLETIRKDNLDRSAIMELRAEYLLKLDKKEEAEKAYRALLDRNNEYRAYYSGLEKSLGLEMSDRKGRKELYSSFAEQHDRLDAARRIPLDFLEGSDFKDAADEYLKRSLQKGVPSLFNNVKSLYGSPEKKQIIQDLVEGYANSKHSNGTNSEQTNGDTGLSRFDESVLYFLAQHYNYRLSRNLKKALQYTDTLIEKFPKRYDYTMNKAKIYKHYGDIRQASKLMNNARELDLKDRYINTKCAKYQLRNNENDVALKTMSKFTRNEGVGGTLGDLLEMQVLWYLTEDGEAYWRQNKFGQALKRFHQVFDIFDVWQEDQFDFHSFSLRKGQIRSYIDMVRWEDRLRIHPFYARAAIDAVKIYTFLYDNPVLAEGGHISGFEDMDEVERKKAIKKAKKEQEKQDKEDLEQQEADRKAAAKKALDSDAKKPDTDPRGAKLLETKEHLEVAMKFLNPLMEFGERDLEAQHVGFEVYLRRSKFYLALKCILTALALDPADTTAHQQIVRLRLSLSKASPDTALLDLVNSSLPAPYNSSSIDLKSLNESFLQKNPKDAHHVFAYTMARQALDRSTFTQNQAAVAKVLSEDPHITIRTTLEAFGVLKQLGMKKDAFTSIVTTAKGKFPEATVFDQAA